MLDASCPDILYLCIRICVCIFIRICRSALSLDDRICVDGQGGANSTAMLRGLLGTLAMRHQLDILRQSLPWQPTPPLDSGWCSCPSGRGRARGSLRPPPCSWHASAGVRTSRQVLGSRAAQQLGPAGGAKVGHRPGQRPPPLSPVTPSSAAAHTPPLSLQP